MSSDTYNRATVEPAQESKRFGRVRDVLQNITQTVETVTRQARFEISGGGVDQIDAPDNLDELVDLAESVGFVWQAYDIFANEVWRPGYRLEGPDETIAYFMGKQDELDAQPPEDTPEGGFLANCGVYAGEKHQDFFDVGKEATFQRRLRGTVLVELLKADLDDPESEITGFNFIRPETISAEVYPNKNILIDPDDTDADGVEITRRGEAAAYIQFDDNSILGRRGRFEDDEEIPLSQNDVHKQVLNPGIGEDTDDDNREQGVFGTPGIKPISEDIAEYRQIKRDRATAIGNKAHGLWLIEHGRDVLDLGNQKKVIEWGDDEMDDFEDRLDDIEPGGFVTYDGSVTPERVDGDVPELESVIQNYIDDIFSGLPISKYKVGFEDDINRDVTSEQSDSDTERIEEEREYQERQWTKVFRTVAERKGLPTDGLRLRIEPEPSDSPVMSMTSDELDKLNTYAQALNTLAGPMGGPLTLVDRDTLLTDVAQLPEDADEGELAERMEEAQGEDADALFRDIMELDTLQAFDDGEVVDTPDGLGVIDDIITEGSVDDMDASEDDPVYAVVVEEEDIGVGFYREDELSSGSIDDLPGPENPEEDVGEGEETDTQAKRDAYQEGFFSWPESWEESPQPARIIALKAWAGMGGSFRGCVREMRGELTGSPDRFCADFKDRLYGTEQWRGGWAD